jgi:hypothetical protein
LPSVDPVTPWTRSWPHHGHAGAIVVTVRVPSSWRCEWSNVMAAIAGLDEFR